MQLHIQMQGKLGNLNESLVFFSCDVAQLFIFLAFNFNCVYVCAHMYAGTHRSQNRVSDTLKLEL